MNATAYAAKVTEIIDTATGNNFEYPESFDADVDACFTRRMTPEAAAEELLADYTAEQSTSGENLEVYEMTIAISLYSFNQEKEYTSFPITAEGLADARELLAKGMAKGHSYQVSDWQFEHGYSDVEAVRRLIDAGDVAAVAEFVRTHQPQM